MPVALILRAGFLFKPERCTAPVFMHRTCSVGSDFDYSARRDSEIAWCIVRRSIKVPFSAALAISVGLIVLTGTFIDQPLLRDLRLIFLDWAVILAAIAVIVGIANLTTVHLQKVTSHSPGSIYSIVLLISLVASLVVLGTFGPTSEYALWMFNYIQVPVETSLLALLAVVLIVGVFGLFTRSLNLLSVVFISAAFISLIGVSLAGWIEFPVLNTMRVWIAQVPALAGARGILLGVALGTVATGLRVFNWV